jgi:peptide deformylase
MKNKFSIMRPCLQRFATIRTKSELLFNAFATDNGGQLSRRAAPRRGMAGNEAGRSPALIDRPGGTAYIARMALRDILILPDKRLRLVSEPVQAIDKEVKALVEDMFETMYDAPGIGLAAIQIGVPRRVVTIDISKKDEEKAPQVFINPELVWSSDDKVPHEEGCLSIPEFYEEVDRPAQVRVKYLGLDGKEHEVEADGILATCLQHEIDHLNGILFIDHISKLKRDRILKKFTKAAKRAAE